MDWLAELFVKPLVNCYLLQKLGKVANMLNVNLVIIGCMMVG